MNKDHYARWTEIEEMEAELGFDGQPGKNHAKHVYGRYFIPTNAPNTQIDLSGFEEDEISDLVTSGVVREIKL